MNNAILRFDQATSRRCIDIGIRDDNVIEPDEETFTATLTDMPSEGIILDPDLAVVTILDETRKFSQIKSPGNSKINNECVCVPVCAFSSEVWV